MDCNGIGKTDLQQYVSAAHQVVELKLIRKIEDLDNDAITFHPEFTHQVFGDTEMIFGYKGLKIKLYYSASKLRLYFDINYTDKVNLKETEGIDADNVISQVKDKLELQNYFTNLDKFVQCLQDEDDFKPYGEKLHEFKSTDNQTFEIYLVKNDDKEFIQNYHEQMQHFLIWFIDGASYIDTEDERWNYFVIYEKVRVNNNDHYYFAGYSTVYCYYAYPEHIRPRISQVLVLPSYQKKNIGFNLLQTINNHYVANSKVIDITVEDPSDNFCQLRNYVDCLNCVKLPSFSKENLVKGWSKEMETEACKVYKIHRQQSRKVYEILELMYTNINDQDAYKKYRLEVKARLAAPALKSKKKNRFGIEKPSEMETPREVIIEELSAAYHELEKEYLKTIERVKLEI